MASPQTDDNSSPPQPQISPAARDLAIRTMIGEESTPTGQAGVASTILNRAQSGRFGGNTPSAVVLAPGQFESWSRNAKSLLDIAPTDPRYQHAAAIFDGVASGAVPDLTGGATHFYAPATQAALGRKPPAWAKGQTGTPLGKTLFFAPNATQNGNAAPALRAINGATANDPDPMRDYEVAPAAASTAPPEPDPMRDYPVAPSTSATPSSAAPQAAGSPREPDPMLDYEVAPSASSGTPVVTPEGVRDSSTGELVVGGKPFTTSQDSPLSTARSAVTGLLSGVPIIGPYIQSGTEQGAAAIRAVTSDTKMSDELADIRARNAADVAAHPVANTLGTIGGAVVGTLPAVVAAPEAFGIGAAAWPLRAATGGLTNAAIGGADSAVRAGGDLGAAERGAVVGGVSGMGGTIAGNLLGAAGSKVLNAFSGSSVPARTVSNMLAEAGLTPVDAQAGLNRLGSAGTLADIDPSLTTEAGALAARGGATTSLMKGAMGARAAGADDIASQLMTAKLGPAPDVEATKQAIMDAAATKAAPLYDAGRAGAPMDVTPVMANINAQLPNASGGIKSILNSVKGFLTNDVATKNNPLGMVVPKDDPSAILGARQALDDMMYNRDSGEAKLGPNAMRVAGNLRAQIDNIVKADPNFAQGDAIYSQAKGVQNAFQQGQDIFKSNMRPADLARTLAAAPPEQADAMRLGARAAIDDAMKSARRGEGPAAQGMFARATNNRANLNLLFPNGQDALDALHSEATMRGTEQNILARSKTAEGAAAMQRWAPQAQPSGISNDLLAAAEGMVAAGPSGAIAAPIVRRGVTSLLSGIQQRSSDNLAQGVARGLVSTGPEQNAFMRQVARAAATSRINKLVSGGSQAAGVIGSQYVRNRLSGPVQ